MDLTTVDHGELGMVVLEDRARACASEVAHSRKMTITTPKGFIARDSSSSSGTGETSIFVLLSPVGGGCRFWIFTFVDDLAKGTSWMTPLLSRFRMRWTGTGRMRG